MVKLLKLRFPMTSEVMDSGFPFSDTARVAMTAKEATK
jgi:hypothetical protein